MTNLFQGCACPQKTVYVSLHVLLVSLYVGVLIQAIVSGNKENIKKSLYRIVSSIATISLWYLLIDYMCRKKNKFGAWVLTGLPVLLYLTLGFVGGNVIFLFADELAKNLKAELKLN